MPYANSSQYLGLRLPWNGANVHGDVAEPCRKAIAASHGTQKPHLLSVTTALALFNMKVAPIATYGLPLIWPKLRRRDLELLDRTKAAFLKRVLGLHWSTRNRLAYQLAGAPLLSEALQKRFKLPRTPAFCETIAAFEKKLDEIDSEFYSTDAMVDGRWRGPMRTDRHHITSFASHGYHHAVCERKGYHDPSAECRCSRCGEACLRYHAGTCPGVESIASLT